MEVAVIGAGFCGLAATWHMLQYIPIFPQLKVTLFDSKGIGQGVSGIAAGLLHPFSGAHAKLNWRGREGMVATQQLLKIASEALGRPVTSNRSGILRLAISDEQEKDFLHCAERYPTETEWLKIDTCQELVPGSVRAPGLWIRQGLTVYSSLYLQGLWQACRKRGAQWKEKTIRTLEDVADFDIVIIATGADTLKIKELSLLTLHSVKGQMLEIAWPRGYPPLPFSLNSHVYLLMTEGGHSCLAGTTYEKGFQEVKIDIEIAKKEILPKVYELYPPLKEGTLLNCFAGMRAVTPNHRPLMQHFSDNRWLLTGMGSKGLLYHALFARELIEQVVHAFPLA